MTKEENYSPEEEKKESVLDFEEAKEMTVGQATRKKEELEAGVNESDNVLDKYIKQHRQEIEAGKFETQKIRKLQEQEAAQAEQASSDLTDFIKERRQEVESEQETLVTQSTGTETASEPEAAPNPLGSRSQRSEQEDAVPAAPVQKTSYGPIPEPLDEKELQVPKTPFYKKKAFLYPVLGLFGIAVAGTGLYFALGHNWGHKTVTSSSSSTSQSSKKSSSSSSSDNTAKDLKSFNDEYAAFFTDSNQTAVKNSKFGDLEKLKTLLEKLKGSKDYDAAKSKYDSLVKQISAIQSVNSQFDGGAITDGILNKEAKANTNATFSDVSSGNAKLDEVLKAAIAQGRSQQVPTPAPATDQGGTGAGTSSGSSSSASGSGASNSYSGYGLPSNGVNLQRDLSRVPYNQAAIDDVNNPAWTFNPGVLEKILQTSRERGYISGDNYILERVNIIKGNGYYNLFKPDGTYLFSINCKTGYFVGNGPGYADSLDF